MNFRKGTLYALYAAMEMARSAGGGPVTAAGVAGRYGISASVLAKTFQQLVRAGLASGMRGVRGGYVLTRPAAEVTVLEVIEAFEPPGVSHNCLIADRVQEQCAECATCPLRRLVDEVDEMARCTYASVTLDTLAGNRPGREEPLPLAR